MKTLTKIYWKTLNFLMVLFAKPNASGALPDKKDIRDFIWIGADDYEKKYEQIDLAQDYVCKDWRFDQTPFNICIFASSMIAASCQDGIRYSVRWMVKLARKHGMITGNGFSYLKAPKKLARKYGMLPIEEMPDETNGMSWNEYSKWTKEDEELLEIAQHYRIDEYKKIRSFSGAYEALDSGFTLCTANMWWTRMMNPQPDKFLLIPHGRKIGGHAYFEGGYNRELFRMTNSFGADWGDNWQAHDIGLFERGDYSVYIQSKLTIEQKIRHFTTYYKGKTIKGTKGTIYLVVCGGKSAFKNWNKYLLWCSQNAKASNSYTLVRDEIINALPDYGIM